MSHKLSLRLRLALIYSALLALALGAFGASAYLLVSQRLYGAVDDSLRLSSEAVLQALAPLDGPLTAQSVEAHRARLNEEARELGIFQVLSPTGEVLYSSIKFSVPISATAPWQGADRPVFITTHVGGQPIRLYHLPILHEGELWGSIEVGQSLRATDNALSEVRNVFVLGGTIALLLTGASAYLLAGRALLPVRRLAELARYIERTGDFRRRLPEPATRGEPRELVSTFNAMIQRLERMLEVQTAFLADSSHELRRPLAVIRANLDALRSDALSPEEQQACLDEIASETEAMAQLISDLLFLSREGAQAIERAPVDLAALCRELGERLREQYPEHTVTVDTDGPVWVLGDRTRLSQIVWNLLENAACYTDPGGRIELRLQSTGEMASLEVRDTGPGIPPDELPHIFERFYRGRRARSRRPQGAGLGLAIVKHGVEVHGGSVTVRSQWGRGTTFTVRLPLAALGS